MSLPTPPVLREIRRSSESDGPECGQPREYRHDDSHGKDGEDEREHHERLFSARGFEQSTACRLLFVVGQRANDLDERRPVLSRGHEVIYQARPAWITHTYIARVKCVRDRDTQFDFRNNHSAFVGEITDPASGNSLERNGN